MPVRSLLRVFLAVLWLWPATALAQIEQWQSHMDAATRKIALVFIVLFLC